MQTRCQLLEIGEMLIDPCNETKGIASRRSEDPTCNLANCRKDQEGLLRKQPHALDITLSSIRRNLSRFGQLQEIIALLDAEGIQPTPDSQPLPAVNKSQVRLVTWMAVSKGVSGPVG